MAQVNQQKGRSDARSAAQGASGSASTGRAPAPRQETAAAGTDAAEAPKAAPSALIVIHPNPKRKNSKAFGFYEKYGPTGVLTNVDAAKERGVRGKDLTWDAERGHILIGTEAEGYPIDGTKEEQIAYLRGSTTPGKNSMFDDKTLIKLGYMAAPEPAPAAEPAVATS